MPKYIWTDGGASHGIEASELDAERELDRHLPWHVASGAIATSGDGRTVYYYPDQAAADEDEGTECSYTPQITEVDDD